MLKLKFQYSGQLMQRTDSLEKTLMLGKTEGGRRRGLERMRRVGDGQGSLACCSPWGHKESDTNEWLNWTDPVSLDDCACVLSHIQLFATLWTIVHLVPLFMGFPRQEYWRGLPFPPPEDLLNPGIESMSPESLALQADSLLMSH